MRKRTGKVEEETIPSRQWGASSVNSISPLQNILSISLVWEPPSSGRNLQQNLPSHWWTNSDYSYRQGLSDNSSSTWELFRD